MKFEGKGTVLLLDGNFRASARFSAILLPQSYKHVLKWNGANEQDEQSRYLMYWAFM